MNRLSGLVNRLFACMQKPGKEFLIGAVWFGCHPAAGLAVVDPLSGRHFAHQPGVNVIRSFELPPKMPADHVPVGWNHKPALPPGCSMTHTLTDREPDGAGHSVTVERVEVKGGAFPEPFVFERVIDPQTGKVTAEVRCGELRNRHESIVNGQSLRRYIDAMRENIQRRVARTGKQHDHQLA